ncbi:MAG: bifunctional metallophosphatase/5'-nucleotidase, partial [Proteobacteria bacterium]|nr:bifunctional metallophosphatase/5'-nucleotidase [Pseudomonadota bacterium]
MKQKLLFLSASLLIAGCSILTKNGSQGTVSTGAGATRVPEEAFRSTDPSQVTIAVVGINDFHGSLLPKESKLPDGSRISSGGASVLYSMVQRLNDEMEGRVLIVDAGDEWQGTLESNSVKGATVVDFFNRLGVKTAAIGNHEFDFGLDNLKERTGNAHYPYVASNILEKKNHRRVRWPNVRAASEIEVAGIKFGIIGVTTQQTPGATRYENVKHLEFVDPAPGVRAESERLRKKGASAVLVTAHAGTECRATQGLKDWGIHLPETMSPGCDEEQEISVLARKAGPGVLDGIVAGHTHQIIHHYLNGVPVVQGEAYNQYFNIIYYTFDKKSRKILPALTRIEGVVPICAEVFSGTRHCDVKRLAEGEAPARVKASFHGRGITPDPAIELWLKPIREGTEKYRKEVVGETLLPLSHYRDRESPFANLIADV